MKRTLTAFSALVFATALAIPAFAQVGAGVAGNANVGDPSMHAGANRDVANSDAERAEPASPTDVTPTLHHHLHHSERRAATEPNNARSIGAEAGANSVAAGADAAVPGSRANVNAGVRSSTDNSPTGGY
jgi:hypothetical protein